MIPIWKKHGIALLMFMSALATTSLVAQDKLVYRGPLKVGAYSGKAIYDYTLVKSDTILNGSFLLQRSSVEALMKNEDASFLIKGAFQDNLANGIWQFQFGDFKSGKRSEVVDYQYRVLVSGRQEQASGVINMGKPDGAWSITVDDIVDSEVDKNLFKSSFTFENGIPQQSFRIENENETLVGRFLRSGLAHDEWSLYSDAELEATETWVFNEGLLQKIVLQTEGGIDELDFTKVSNSPLKTVSLDANYLKAIRLQKVDSSKNKVLNGALPKLLSENAGYYQKIDALLSELGKSSFLPEYKVKLPYYPLNEEERKRLLAIQKSAAAANHSSEILLNSTQFNILKLSDEDALFTYRVVEALQEKYVVPLKEMASYIDGNILDYVLREQLFASLFPEGYPQKNIRIKNETTGELKSFELPDSGNYDFKGNNLSAIENIAKYAAQSLDSIQLTLKSTLEQEQRAKELVDVEEKLIAANAKLQVLADSLDNETPAYIVVAIERIKSFADEELAAYAKTEVLTEKIADAERLTKCLVNLHELGESVLQIPAQWLEIEKLYQDRVWNPFMATVMDEAIKKRMTNAYRKVVTPYFLKEIEQNLNCDIAAVLRKQIQGSYQTLIQLRAVDTKKLERKLRKEKDPKKIINLLQEATSPKENQE